MPTTRVGDIDIFYQDHDFADPWKPHDTVFMQHGYSRNSNFWRAWVPRLSREFRVVRMDLRGCGQSGDPGPDYRYRLDGLVADFVGFLDALEIDKVHYVGESIGARLGVGAVVAHPERFKSLTLVSSGLRVGGATPTVSAMGYPSWQDAIQALGMKEWRRRLMVDSGERSGDPAQDDYWAAEVARTPAHVAVALSQFAPTVNITELLPRISVPTLLLNPGASIRMSREDHETMVRLIPNVRAKLYEGANHSMYCLTPDPLAQDTLEFLRSLRGE